MFFKDLLYIYDNSGKMHFPSLDYSKEEILDLISKSLYNSNRFNGVTDKPCSTMHHSIMVGMTAYDLYQIYYGMTGSKRERMLCFIGGLSHDVGETLIADIISPVKHRTGSVDKLEELEKVFVNGFMDLIEVDNPFESTTLSKIIKEADTICGILETMAHFSGDSFSSSNIWSSSYEKVRRLYKNRNSWAKLLKEKIEEWEEIR